MKTIKTIHSIGELRTELNHQRDNGQRIGLVPTMGNLHEGHLQLVTDARQHADIIVASIFVNPMQFGANEDLDAYPRTLTEDTKKLATVGTDIIFAPSTAEMYPSGMNQKTQVIVPQISDHHCGKSRPIHFIGVATVVSMLFNIVQPDVAIFGEKDYQQLAVIRKFCQDLKLSINIISTPTVREADGLAKSSRNGYLTAEQRQKAPLLNQLMNEVAQHVSAGNKDFRALTQTAEKELAAAGFIPDYFNIAHSHTLDFATPEDTQITILVAAWLGDTRLIDNISLHITE